MQSRNIFILGVSFLGAYFFLPTLGYQLQSPIAKVSTTPMPVNEFSKFKATQTKFSHLYDKEDHIVKQEVKRFHLFHGKKVDDGKVIEKINPDVEVNDMTYK
jgi:hypothetical protein